MLCPFCRAENPPRFSFCGYCGKPLAPPPSKFDKSSHTETEGSRNRGDGQCFATVLLVDIAGFTRISEGLDPEEVTRLINSCLGEMTKEAIKYGGSSNKYIGDGLMSIFGQSPIRRQNAKNAAEAALAMHQSVADLRLGPAIPPIALHAGIACSTILTIEIGIQAQKEHIFIGPAVDLASQLEELSAPGQTLVSEEVYHLIARDFTLRPISLSPQLRLKTTQTVYELVK